MSHYSEYNLEGRKAKEILYNLYYEILEEIKGSSISIDQEEFEEKISSIKIPKLIQYIKNSIQILLEKKVDEYQKAIAPKTSKDNELQAQDYEQLLREYEKIIKSKHRKLFQYKYKIESLELQIKSYMEMEDDFEDMKDKLKYEDGKFLNNDRKENEIRILRSENSNLKAVIHQYDEEKKERGYQSKKDKETITFLQSQIEELNLKIMLLEKNQNDSNSSINNSHININNNFNSNNNASVKLILKHKEDKHYTDKVFRINKKTNFDSDRNKPPPLSERTQLEAKIKFINAKRKKGQQKTIIVDKNGIYDIYKRILNDLNDENESPKKSGHQKNHSVVDVKNKKMNDNVKYFPNNLVNINKNNNNNNNGYHSNIYDNNNHIAINPNRKNNNGINYIKINKKFFSTKPPISSRPHHNQSIGNPNNKLYISNAKGGNNHTINRSLISMHVGLK